MGALVQQWGGELHEHVVREAHVSRARERRAEHEAQEVELTLALAFALHLWPLSAQLCARRVVVVIVGGHEKQARVRLQSLVESLRQSVRALLSGANEARQ